VAVATFAASTAVWASRSTSRALPAQGLLGGVQVENTLQVSLINASIVSVENVSASRRAAASSSRRSDVFCVTRRPFRPALRPVDLGTPPAYTVGVTRPGHRLGACRGQHENYLQSVEERAHFTCLSPLWAEVRGKLLDVVASERLVLQEYGTTQNREDLSAADRADEGIGLHHGAKIGDFLKAFARLLHRQHPVDLWAPMGAWSLRGCCTVLSRLA
jgi:hypothetical protein